MDAIMKAGLGGGSGVCGGGGGGSGGWGGAIADFVDMIEADFMYVVVACFVVMRNKAASLPAILGPVVRQHLVAWRRLPLETSPGARRGVWSVARAPP